jgi:Protein of unknown function (DUF2934)
MSEARAPRKSVSKAATAKRADTLSREEIARRAYEIAQSEAAGSDEENWLRAEAELRREH